MAKRLWIIAVLNLLFAAGGILAWYTIPAPADPAAPAGAVGGYDGILALTFFAIATTTFFGLLSAGSTTDRASEPGGGSMRLAIAATIVLTYLFCIGTSVFLMPQGDVNPITREFIQSFSGIVGVTVAFYFGASAAHQIFGRDKSVPAKAESTDGDARA
jgi:hypothetical protein